MNIKKLSLFGGGAGDDESSFKGSCRSDGKTHLVDLMQACTEGTFSAMGGHELAGGFSVSFEKIHELENELNKAYNKTKHNQIGAKQKIVIDGELSLLEVNLPVNKAEDLYDWADIGTVVVVRD